ncbi:MAG: hypothetical protein JW720_10860 [Sedimentisphaerales bacterium]|nr:hypothetical protein [Sedimentisphaerales bacterium]
MNYDAKIFLGSLFGIQVCEDLPPKWAEEYEERAGVLEFDGCLPRKQAETQALKEITARNKNTARKRA